MGNAGAVGDFFYKKSVDELALFHLLLQVCLLLLQRHYSRLHVGLALLQNSEIKMPFSHLDVQN